AMVFPASPVGRHTPELMGRNKICLPALLKPVVHRCSALRHAGEVERADFLRAQPLLHHAEARFDAVIHRRLHHWFTARPDAALTSLLRFAVPPSSCWITF